MESTKSGHRTVSGRGRGPINPGDGRIAKTDPRSRLVNRSSRASRYSGFADEVLSDLDPRGPLERLMADHVIYNAWKLKTNLENQAARDRAEKSDLDAEPSKARIRPTEIDRAARSMREALDSLDFLRARFPGSEMVPVEQDFDTDILPNEWPIVPTDGLDELPEVADAAQDEAPNWQDRLVFDFEVSEISPVVKGTWVTVGHVISLIVDGSSWADILRSHPELTEDDIRTCVAYAMAEEIS